jgi:hypothetical protein
VTIFVPTSPLGYTIFCDDIRQEDNGKLLYIGVYTGDMTFSGPPPGLLTTFCAFVNYLERPTDSLLPIRLVMMIPGVETPAASIELDLAKFRETLAPIEGEDPMYRIMIPLRMGTLIIPQQGLIKVRAYRGDDELRLGTLNVKFGQPAPVPPTG